MTKVLVDTGPLVAFFDRSSSQHAWVVEQFKSLTSPLETCEPVISEVLFLLKRAGIAPDPLFEMIERDVLRLSFRLSDEFQSVRKLLQKYKSLPTSLADACLVRMSETTTESVVFTLDRDFLVYRRNRMHTIPLLAPFL
jgi:predicted nucleic acid-binding protein